MTGKFNEQGKESQLQPFIFTKVFIRGQNDGVVDNTKHMILDDSFGQSLFISDLVVWLISNILDKKFDQNLFMSDHGVYVACSILDEQFRPKSVCSSQTRCFGLSAIFQIKSLTKVAISSAQTRWFVLSAIFYTKSLTKVCLFSSKGLSTIFQTTSLFSSNQVGRVVSNILN